MKQPWVYMCSPSQSPLPPPSPPAPSRFSQCTRSERLSHASNLGWWSKMLSPTSALLQTPQRRLFHPHLKVCSCQDFNYWGQDIVSLFPCNSPSLEVNNTSHFPSVLTAAIHNPTMFTYTYTYVCVCVCVCVCVYSSFTGDFSVWLLFHSNSSIMLRDICLHNDKSFSYLSLLVFWS